MDPRPGRYMTIAIEIETSVWEIDHLRGETKVD
jgi:hypothetical protein